jgi:putative restriction endonuclease
MVNQYQRAAQAWPVLTETASQGTKISYLHLAQRLGIHHRPIRFVLAVIQDHCLNEKLPPLTILVVSQGRGLPGEGFIAWNVDDLDEGYRLVYAYPWGELPNPFAFASEGATLNQLAQRLVTKPEASPVVYRQINNRGIAQDVFRRALLDAYRHRCAFCNLSLKAALQAAHIIPWSQATIAQRLDPRNGLLLCATHHALFDSSVLTVSTDLHVVCRLEGFTARHWTEADTYGAIALHGRPISMPADPRLRPSLEALEHRASRLPGLTP